MFTPPLALMSRIATSIARVVLSVTVEPPPAPVFCARSPTSTLPANCVPDGAAAGAPVVLAPLWLALRPPQAVTSARTSGITSSSIEWERHEKGDFTASSQIDD